MALEKESSLWSDMVTGTAAELVAAGIVTADMLPGQPGRGKVMCTYMNGLQQGQGSQTGRSDVANESYRQIMRRGKDRYQVRMGISPAELARRRALQDAAREQAHLADWQCLAAAHASPCWIDRVGQHFAVRVVRRQHLRAV